MSGYLFVHFTGEHKDGEQIYFSASRDGLHWKDLNGGRPVLYSRTGTCGVRDPFLVRDPRKQQFYLIATDLRIEAGLGWRAAEEEGSRDLIVWRSADLVNWGKEEAHTVGVPQAGCVWAPEAVYDKEREAFLVFFASMTRLAGETEGKQRIYAVWTRDFREFSEPFVYLEREHSVIDTTILEDGGYYYRISKDEVRKKLILEQADRLTGVYTRIPSQTLDDLAGVEGPEGYLLPDGRTWCVIADRFAEGKGYLPLLTEDLASGIFTIPEEGSYDMGAAKKRHGGILPVTDEEFERLLDRYGRER